MSGHGSIDKTLSVLEATAPAPGPLRPLLAFYVRHGIPLLGRLSPDPSAYRYLSDSIFEFGSGPEFDRDLADAGFEVAHRRSFLLGATRLWVARRAGGVGQIPAAGANVVQSARAGAGEIAQPDVGHDSGIGAPTPWLAVQATLAVVLLVALVWALVVWTKLNRDLPLTAAQRSLGWVLVTVGVAGFGARSVWLGLRLLAGARGR